MTAFLITAAAQGNAIAIEQLINCSLSRYGFSAQVTAQGTVLSIVIEGKIVPCVSKTTRFVRKGLEKLSPANIITVQVYGKAAQDSTPAWKRQWTLKLLGVWPEPSMRVFLPRVSARPVNALPALPPLSWSRVSEPLFQPQPLAPLWKQRMLIGCVSILLLGFVYEVSARIQNGRSMLAQAVTLEKAIADPQGDIDHLQAAKTDLQKAIQLLEQVPSLPGAGKQLAIQKLPDLRDRLRSVDRQLQMATQSYQQQQQATYSLEKSQQLALEANRLVRIAPGQLSTWEEADAKWQQAIITLETIPKGTVAFEVAQRRLIAYRNTHDSIVQQLAVETNAISNYELASQWIDEALRLTADLDLLDPQNLDQLQDAQGQLEQAFQLLKSIPPHAHVSDAAQQSLTDYTADYLNLTEAVTILESCTSEGTVRSCQNSVVMSSASQEDE